MKQVFQAKNTENKAHSDLNMILQSIVENNEINQAIQVQIKTLSVTSIEQLSHAIVGSMSLEEDKKAEFLKQLIDISEGYSDVMRKCIARSIGSGMGSEYRYDLISHALDRISDDKVLGDMIFGKLIGEQAFQSLNAAKVINKITDLKVLKRIAKSCLLTQEVGLRDECIKALLAQEKQALFKVLALEIVTNNKIDINLDKCLKIIIEKASSDNELLGYLVFKVFLNKDNFLNAEARASYLRLVPFGKADFHLIDAIAEELKNCSVISISDKIPLLSTLARAVRDNRIEIHTRLINDIKILITSIPKDEIFLELLPKLNLFSNSVDTIDCDLASIIASRLQSKEAVQLSIINILSSDLNTQDKMEVLSNIEPIALITALKQVLYNNFFDCFSREKDKINFCEKSLILHTFYPIKQIIDSFESLAVLGTKIVNKFNAISSPLKSPTKSSSSTKSIFFHNKTAAKDCILMFLNGGKTIQKLDNNLDLITQKIAKHIEAVARSNRNKESITFMISGEQNSKELMNIASNIRENNILDGDTISPEDKATLMIRILRKSPDKELSFYVADLLANLLSNTDDPRLALDIVKNIAPREDLTSNLKEKIYTKALAFNNKETAPLFCHSIMTSKEVPLDTRAHFVQKIIDKMSKVLTTSQVVEMLEEIFKIIQTSNKIQDEAKLQLLACCKSWELPRDAEIYISQSEQYLNKRIERIKERRSSIEPICYDGDIEDPITLYQIPKEFGKTNPAKSDNSNQLDIIQGYKVTMKTLHSSLEWEKQKAILHYIPQKELQIYIKEFLGEQFFSSFVRCNNSLKVCNNESKLEMHFRSQNNPNLKKLMNKMDEVKDYLKDRFNAMPLERRLELFKGDDIQACLITFMHQKKILHKVYDFIIKVVNCALSLITEKRITWGTSFDCKKSWVEDLMVTRALNEVNDTKKAK